MWLMFFATLLATLFAMYIPEEDYNKLSEQSFKIRRSRGVGDSNRIQLDYEVGDQLTGMDDNQSSEKNKPDL